MQSVIFHSLVLCWSPARFRTATFPLVKIIVDQVPSDREHNQRLNSNGDLGAITFVRRRELVNGEGHGRPNPQMNPEWQREGSFSPMAANLTAVSVCP
jgi:hypothetical protein